MLLDAAVVLLDAADVLLDAAAEIGGISAQLDVP